MPEEENNKKKEGEEEEQPSSSNLPIEDSNKLIADANAVAQRIEEANAKTEELAQRMEKAAVRTALGGKADAGQPEAKEEMSDKEYADKVLSGEIEGDKPT